MSKYATQTRTSLATTLAIAGALALSTGASAQEPTSVAGTGIAPEINRDARDLVDVLRPHPDTDSVDTALVFTNPRNAATLVVCAARDSEGVGVGRARTVVPGHGVRLIFASDLSDGRDYVGSATCKSRSRVVPSAFIVGADLSDAPAKVTHGWQDSQMNFPVIATF